MSDEPLRPEGLRALREERAEKMELKRELREVKTQLHNLRAAVIDFTNELIDPIESDGAVRRHKEGA